MRHTLARRLSAFLIASVGAWATHPAWAAAPLAPQQFDTGSFVIPMDTDGQDNGMLRAYGLVYDLVRNGVPVHQAIAPGKLANGDDFVVAALGFALRDVEAGTIVGLPRAYRGGPFVVAAADSAAARPIITAWLGNDSVTVVHELILGTLSLEIARTLTAAPRIGILLDGNHDIAFANLNAAGITDATGAEWSVTSPDLLTEAQIAGATNTNHADGILFHTAPAAGLPRYCHVASMHYTATAATPEVVNELRNWLDAGALTHAYAQCASTEAIENAAAGRFLTTAGIEDFSGPPPSPNNRFPSDPLNQIDGAFNVDNGTVDSMQRAGGAGTFRTGVRTMINEDGASLLTRIVLMTGNLDGDAGNGRVTYLGGHDYSTSLPISTNAQTNGVRLFLNSVFQGGCATSAVQSPMTLVATAPALTTASTITFSISYSNPGPRPVEHVVLSNVLPAGTSFASAPPAEGGVHNGGVMTWNLGTVASGASATKQFTVNVTGGDGTYANVARVAFTHMTVNKRVSNTSSTTVDTSAPTVSIDSGPAGPSNDDTPTFGFTISAGGSPTTPECRLFSNPPGIPPAFGPCTGATTYTSTTLAQGAYTFEVRAIDGVGNVGPASSRNFSIDLVAPSVTVDSGPPQYTNDNTPSFAFTVSADVSPTTPQCRVYASSTTPPAFGACTSASGHTHTPVGDGARVFEVRAVDAANNAGPIASLNFTVDTVPPMLFINGGYLGETNNTTPTFNFTASAGGGSPITLSCRVTTFPPTPSPPFGPCTSASSHTTDALADGIYQFEVRVVAAAGNNGPNAENRSFSIDTVAPRVTAVNSIAVADWSPAGALAIGVAVTKVLVTFDDDMWQGAGPNQVIAFANWRPVAAGPNGVIDTTGCGTLGGDDVALPIGLTEIRFGSRTAAIFFGDNRGKQAGRHRLIACATMTDAAGNGLDGAGDGGAAEQYVIDFNVVTNPLVVNPNFDGGIWGWTASGPVPAAWSHAADGTADGEAQVYSGAARLNTSAGAGATWRLEQCVTANAGLFSFTGLTRITSATPGEPSVQLTVLGAASADCSGTLTPIAVSMPIAGDTGNAWSTLFAPVNPPPGTQSLRLSFDVSGGAASSYTVEFDRALYPGRIELFKDSFETESP